MRVIRPASNGANVTLTFITTTHNCGLALAVPTSVDLRHHGLLGTLNTGLMLARTPGNVNNTVTGTRRVITDSPDGCLLLRRFGGPTGPRVRRGAAKPRV